ncbi:MAG: DUF1592 domain-containing protein [Verrucomicrobia bacterium]|nr:DUF1592 domain-containing protein [Verrucomicrobiota bacterium]
MIKRTLLLLPCCLIGVASAADGEVFAGHLQPVFAESCVKCHGEKGKVKGKVNLLELGGEEELLAKPDLLADLIEALEYEDMPPEDEELLAPEVRREMIGHLEGLLARSVASGVGLPETPLRRMNRFQYSNAVRDLFDLKVEVFSLPERMLREYGAYFQPAQGTMPSKLKAGSRPLGKSQLIEPRLEGVAPFPQDLRAEHGYDNQADHLSLSPLLLESFLKLSRSIVESPDFNAKNCGIWREFFEPPKAGVGSEKEVRGRLERFLRLAFRGPVEEELLGRYTVHVLEGLERGKGFTECMKMVASATLASPRFLYLYEEAEADAGMVPVNDFELASRLSFFLWGSLPDRPLLALAAGGKLRDPGVLEGQVDRMMDDVRMKRFCDSFPAQWLQLDRIISSRPDPERYPEFYFSKYRASMHMMLEPLLLFETVFVEDRSILELIDSDFSYRSAFLEKWYRSDPKQVPTPPVEIPYERVVVKDRREGGVLTTAAVMTMTSNATRTQPITRGAWVATVIFNDPPEPPPADVPPLPEATVEEAKEMTLRERFEDHRKRPDCAGCHVHIDPLGFALENYGPTGAWRDEYENGRKVDSSGVLFRKHTFTNIVEFKDAILSEKDRFARGFAGHLLAYALGRGLGAADAAALDRIVRVTEGEGFKMRAVMKQIVLSDPFLHKSHALKPKSNP